ncbi:protein polybromo-1-like isoform X8 [Pecten maximus]|uniref:protein polybromo-1-like isoform X8 n=1 Tax=Pecten maximus TaxID=6579 RepID=UPI001458F426|nr:protein polybromo-1-like isoform X8 [Pecten maximus]
MMAPKRKKPPGSGDNPVDEREESPGPSMLPNKRRKKSLQYDPVDICQELYDTIRNYKTEDGRLICETFIRAPKRRTAADYYDVVSTPIDLLKIQQKLKTEEYEDIDQLSTDIELMINNAKSYYKKDSQEYKDACDMWELFNETRSEVISEAFGELVPGDRRAGRAIATDSDDLDDDKESSNDSSLMPVEPDTPEDLESLFTSVMMARDGEREISPAFHLLPSKSFSGRKKYPEYYQIIKQPIDMKIIGQRLQAGAYTTLDDLEKDFLLMAKNAKTFNEPKSLIYKDAQTLKKVVQTRKVDIQNKIIPKPGERASRSRDKCSWSSYCANLPYPVEETFEPPVSQDSNMSMDYDDDSGTETVVSELEEGDPYWALLNYIKAFKGPSGTPLCEPFLKLPSKRFYPDYYEEIKKPMSLSNVRKKLKYKQYRSLDKLTTDINLVFENAKQYNADESKIYQDAVTLQQVMWDRKHELERGDSKDVFMEELSSQSDFPSSVKSGHSLDSMDDDSHKSRHRRSGSGAPDSDKKRAKRATPEDMMRRRLWTIYKTVHDYSDTDGRPLRMIFMELPSKRDYPDYYQVILQPIDMVTIEAKIKGEKYYSENELIVDFELMFNNARHYNEEESQVYKDANTLEKLVKNKWRNMLQTMEARKALSRNVKTNVCEKSTRMKDKKVTPLPTKLQDIYNTIHNYQDARGRALATPFLKLPLKTEYPDYYEVIKKPVDMQRIQQKLTASQYESVEDMVADFVQMFDNACKYNEPDSLIYKDALTLQRVCLEKKLEMSNDGVNDIPDVRAAVQEMMTSLFISTYNFQDEEGRCYSDSFAELPERDPDEDLETSKQKEKPLSFDQIKRNLDKGRYRRFDKFQEDMFEVFERARRLSRTDSQLYEDAVEMHLYFIKTRDETCRNGEILLTPALSYTERHLQASLDAEKIEKLPMEQQSMEEKRARQEAEEYNTPSEGGLDSFRYKEETFHVGDFVYIEPREKGQEPHIMCIEKLFVDQTDTQMLHGNWFYRPNETFHLATRKFLEKEVLKSDSYTSIPITQVLGKCFIMFVKDYFKYRPEGIADHDVYVCENRYVAKHKCFKKIKIWQSTKNEHVSVVPRDIPLVPVRVSSVFADKEKDIIDDGDNSILDKKRRDVQIEIPNGEEGCVYYDQLNTAAGTLKLGDGVYIKSDREKQLLCRIDKIWVNRSGETYLNGPWYIYPSDIEHSPTRLFYKNEVFACGIEDTISIDRVAGKCSILHIKDYLTNRVTETPEEDVYLCESKYFELEKMVKKLGKGLKKYVLSPKVTDDELYFFRKPITPQKVVDVPYLDGDDSQDGDTEAADDTLNVSMEVTPVPEKPPKKTEDDHGKEKCPPKKSEDEHPKEKVVLKKNKLTGAKSNMKRQISGYIVYSGEIRKHIQQENPDCTFGEISRIVGLKEKPRRHPSGYILFSKEMRKVITQEAPSTSFGEISRLVGEKWRNLSKEEKEKYEEKAKKVAEEQQAKQQEAERAFNESLNRSQSPWDGGRASPGSSGRPITPGGYQGQYNYQGYGIPQGAQSQQYAPMQGLHNVPTPGMVPRPGQGMSPMTPQRQYMPYTQQSGMRPMSMGQGPYPGSPQGQPHTPHPGMASPHPAMSPGPTPGTVAVYPGMPPSPHAGMPPQSMGQGPQMAPPPPPPRPPSPMFVSVPPRTQRLLHSEAYLRYIEGLSADKPHISEWEKNLSANSDNTLTDESRLPAHWLAQGAGYHGNVTDALWALRDLMMKDTMSISRTLPFEAL